MALISLPLDNIEECFNLNFPKCLGIITKCPNLQTCHNKYSGTTEKGRETLLRIIDFDINFWKWAMIAFALTPIIAGIIYLLLKVI